MVNKWVDMVNTFRPSTDTIRIELNSGGNLYFRIRTWMSVKIHESVISNLKNTACLSRYNSGLNRYADSWFHCIPTIHKVIIPPANAMFWSQKSAFSSLYLRFNSSSAIRNTQKKIPKKISGAIPPRLWRICISWSLIFNFANMIFSKSTQRR